MKFKVVNGVSNRWHEFEDEINSLLADGWKFHGTIFITEHDRYHSGLPFTRIHQAMLLEKQLDAAGSGRPASRIECKRSWPPFDCAKGGVDE